MPTLNTVLENDLVSEISISTSNILETAFEDDSAALLTGPSVSILIAAESSVTTGIQTSDMLLGRDVLEPSGSMKVDLSAATLEPGEPIPSGYTKTVWFELPINPNTTLTQRIKISSPTSVARVTVYKQVGLDDFSTHIDLDEDEQLLTDPMLSEPRFDFMDQVQAGSSDQVFTLDQEYGSSYFLQVGLISGPGNDFTMTWEDAAPLPGGMFEDPIENTGLGGVVSISTKNARIQSGEPNSAGITETRSVWMKWTAPVGISTPINFTVYSGGPSAFVAGIYTGSTINGLTLVASSASTAGEGVVVTITPTANTVYWVRIATTIDDTSYTIAWSKPRVEYPAAEPVQSLLVTVHAGPKGGSWGGVTYAPNAMITELPNRMGVQFQESLNVPGSGSVTVRQDDAIIRAFNPTSWPATTGGSWTAATQSTWSQDPFLLLQFGNIIKFWMFNTGTQQSKCVFAFSIKNREINIVGSGEEGDRIITVSGPSVMQLLADFYVVHDNYPAIRGGDMRLFNWAAVVGPSDKWSAGGWFDSTGTFTTNKRSWNNPINISSLSNVPGYRKKRGESYKKRPKYALIKRKKKKWPDRTSRWMWIEASRSKNQIDSFPPVGKNPTVHHYYKSKSLNISKGGLKYRFSVYCDTYYEIYVDGVLFFSGNGNESYKNWRHRDMILSATTSSNPHNISVYVEDRKKNGKDYDHNDAFLFSIQQLNSKGKPVKTVLRSNRSSWYVWHGPNPPAWSHAMVMATVIREAQARGNESAKMIQMRTNFGQVSEEGSAWNDQKSRNIAIQIGTSALDLQAQFSETNRFDVSIDPDTLTLRGWQGGGSNGGYPRGVDKSANVALVPGYNLVNWTVSETDDVKNKLLVQYGEGNYVYVSADTHSGNYETIQKYGQREGYLELGGINDKWAAIDNAKSILTYTGNAESIGGSSDIVGHVSESYNGSVIPVRGAVPFLDWEVGDSVSAPASNSVLHPHRVLSITCTEDAEGNLTFDPELQGV